MTYLLAGLTRLGAALDRSAFLIPYFRRRTSNLFFAQELGADHSIIEFRPFNPFSYSLVDTVTQPIERNVGDLGIMAFVRRGDAPTIGTVDEIISALRVTNLAGDRSPFFEIDAYRLTGQAHQLPGALKRARKALGSGPIAKRWLATEKLLDQRARTAEPRTSEAWDSEIEALARDLGRKDWTRRWVDLWNGGKVRDRLVEVGLDFVENGPQSVAQTGRILSRLTRHYEYRPERLRPVTEAWLNHCARVQPIEASWPRVWRGITADDLWLGVEMFNLGTDFLTEAAAADRVTAEWASVANILLQKPPPNLDASGKIFELARKLLVDGSLSQAALRPVTKALAKTKGDPRALRVLEDWLKADRNHGNAWIDAYLQVLAVRGGDADLLNLGLVWLQEDEGRLRRWKQIYFAIEEQIGPSSVLLEAASDWVLRANRDMTTWPEMAAEVLSRRDDPEVRGAATAWLRENGWRASAVPLTTLLKG